MRAGQLRHPARHQRDLGTKDSLGQHVPKWATLGTRWIGVVPVSSGERSLADKLYADMTHEVQARHSSSGTIQTGDRLILGQRILEIVGPPMNIEERGRELRIFCKEVVC